ncbi:MAG TPA: alpha/beta hydrolase [Bryobacteraceae bacterium]|nr:alpha/beta hydrolase [Bryobacteraceae bacterium]
MSRPEIATVDGRRLETLWIPAAVEGAPAIVMLHEGLGSIAHWKDFPAQLAARTGCGVLVYSRYGSGNSERLAEKRDAGYLHREAEVVLPALLGQMGIGRPVLLGHSDGASIALIFAGKFPGAAAALILEAPHVFVEDMAIDSIARARTAYLTTDLPEKLARYHGHVDETFWGWNNIWLDPRFRSWNIEEYLPAIQCPVLVIQGQDDEYGTVRQVEAIQAKAPQTEVLLLAHCGHAPHRDQPEATLENVAEFIGYEPGGFLQT